MFYEFFLNNDFFAYMLVIIVTLFAYIAQWRVNSVFRKYNSVVTTGRVPANVIARQILDSYGLYNVQVMRVSGNLTDHYDPKTNVVALSDSVFDNPTIASIGVAAHEVGHAVQYNTNYLPIRLRAIFVPVAQFGSSTWIYFFLIGMFASIPFLVDVGVILFALIVLFQVLTLPVELDASRRAMRTIKDQFLLGADEQAGARKTLSAAAMTYITGLMVAMAQLFRLILMSRRRRN